MGLLVALNDWYKAMVVKANPSVQSREKRNEETTLAIPSPDLPFLAF